MQGICSVCGREGRIRKGWCDAHYFRWRRTGDPGPATIVVKQPGRTCSVNGCGQPNSARGLCRRHYTRWQRHGDTSTVKTPAPRTGPANNMWRGDAASYGAVHRRLAKVLGPAREHNCADCGSPADEWAYDHTDPNERRGSEGPYSTDITRYQPMCRSHHRRLDLALSRARSMASRP